MNTRLPALLALAIAAPLLAGCHGAASRKAAYIARAQQYYNEQNYQKARVEISNALQIDPKSPPAHYLAGEIEEKLGDPRGALGNYQAAVDGDAGNQNARAALARLFVIGGAPDRALQLVEPGLAAAPNNPQLLTARGAAKGKLGDLKGGVQDGEAALALAPDDPYTIALLAGLYSRLGQDDKAIAALRDGVARRADDVDLRVALADAEFRQHDLNDAEQHLKDAIGLAPKKLELRFALAQFYAVAKEYDSAEKTLREAIAIAPDDLRPKLALVNLIGSQRGPAQAEAQLQQFIKADPENDQLQLALADLLQRRSLSERTNADAASAIAAQAESAYRAIITHAGTGAAGITARDHLAQMYLAQNSPDRAVALIDEVLRANPRDADAQIMHGDLALAHGDAATAITDFRSVLRDQPNDVGVLRALARAEMQNNQAALAEEALRTAAQAAPQNPDVVIELAQVLQRNNKPDQALAAVKQLAAALPDDRAVAEQLVRLEVDQKDLAGAAATAADMQRRWPDQAVGYYMAGIVDEGENKPDAAAQEYEHAMAVQPQGAEPLTALIHLEAARKQYQRAGDRLDATLARYPDNSLARRLKGWLLFAQSQPEAGTQAYQDAIARQPADWTLYRELATCQFEAKQAEAAVQTLNQGIGRNPQALGLVLDLGALDERLGHIDDAIKAYDAALAHNPGSLGLANNLAMMLVTYRQDPASLKRAQELAKLLEGDFEAPYMDTRGWVLYKSGDDRGAIPLLQQAVDKAPDVPVMRYHLGEAQYRTGDTADARSNLEVAINAPRPYIGLDEARATLDHIRRAQAN